MGSWLHVITIFFEGMANVSISPWYQICHGEEMVIPLLQSEFKNVLNIVLPAWLYNINIIYSLHICCVYLSIIPNFKKFQRVG